jgi:PAS domain S-box-containing protein
MPSNFNNRTNDLRISTLESLKKSINSLSEAYELLELIFDQQGNAIDFKFLFVNPAYEKQTGLKAADIIGKLKKENAPASDQRWYDCAIQAAITGKTLNYEYFNYKTNRYCETQFIPISTKEIAVIFKDITESKKAEKKLKKSESKYRALIEATNTGYLIIDKKGNVIDANDEYVHLTGHKKLNEIMGRNVIEWTADADKQKNAEAVKKCIKNGFIKNLVIHYIDDTRKIKTVEISAAVTGSGGSTQIVSLCQDISDREKTEMALRESEEKYEQLVEGLPEMVLEVNTQGQVTFANSKVVEMTGYSKEELMKIDANRLVASQDIERSRDNMIRMFTEGKRQSNEYLFAKKDGTLFPILLNSIPIQKNKKIIGIRGIMVDITDRKNLEQQLKEKERLAAIGATAGWVGHDIRNPLQAMLSDAYLLKDCLAAIHSAHIKNEATESLRDFESNIGYINKIVADLQDYSRPLKPESVNFNLYELVTDVFVPFDLPQNIAPTIEIDPSLAIRSDPTLIRRILTNLIINAIQAMPEGGKLTILCTINGDKTTITVQDTGEGIPESVKPRLFTPMTTTKAKGQGLGLAVVKRLVETLNGTIAFDSKNGKGTKFIIDLPLQK